MATVKELVDKIQRAMVESFDMVDSPSLDEKNRKVYSILNNLKSREIPLNDDFYRLYHLVAHDDCPDCLELIRDNFKWSSVERTLKVREKLPLQYLNQYGGLLEYCQFDYHQLVDLFTQMPSLYKIYKGQDPALISLGELLT